ncbi:MAG: hypothetical protein AAFR56_11305, partial [Chloroflexota bacterium]
FVVHGFTRESLWWVTALWVAGLVLVFTRGGLYPGAVSWQSMEHGQLFRVFTMVLVITMAWYTSTLAYNEYMGQFYGVERILIVVFAVLVWFNPWFIVPSFMLALMMVYQLAYPFPTTTIDKTLLWESLYLLLTFVVLRVVVRIQPHHALLALLVLAAAHYNYAGFSKLATEGAPLAWVYDSGLDNLYIASYQHGWLSMLPEATALQIAGLIGTPLGEIGLNGFALVAEAGMLAVLFNRRVALVALALQFLLHAGIVAATGIFFWKWMVVLVALGWWMVRLWNTDALTALYRPVVIAGALLLTLAVRHTTDVQIFYWFNTPVNHIYELKAVTEDGEVYHVPRRMMEPDAIYFMQNELWGLSEDLHISRISGTTATYEDYTRIKETEDIRAYIAEYGEIRYSEFFEQLFTEYMRRVFDTPHQHRWIDRIASPTHINYTYHGDDRYDGETPIRAIRVVMRTTYYTGHSIEVLDEKVVTEIPIVWEAAAR